MKKFLTSITILTLITGYAVAQDANSIEPAHFGIKMGANLSNIYDKEGGQYSADPRLGLAAGVFFSIPLGLALGVQPEIMYSQKGYQASGSISGGDFKYRHTSHFIDVPLFLMFRPVPELSLLGGPQFSFLLSENDEFTNTTFSDPNINEEDFLNQNVRKNTFGLAFGGDLNLDHIVIGLRVGYDLLDNNGDGTQTSTRYKNVYLQSTIGYRF